MPGENVCTASCVVPTCAGLGEKSAINGDTVMPGVLIALELLEAVMAACRA